MTEEQRNAITELRNQGYAVCVFTPVELAGSELYQRDMEEQLSSTGNQLIDFHRLEED